jgi:hypothetical protein
MNQRMHPQTGYDSWTATYNNPAIFESLLSHERSTGAVGPAQAGDGKQANGVSPEE